MTLPLKKNNRFSLNTLVYRLTQGCLFILLLSSFIYYFLYSSNNVLYLDIYSPENTTVELFSSYQNQPFNAHNKIDLDLKPGRHHYRINTYQVKFDQFYFELSDQAKNPDVLSQLEIIQVLHKKIFQTDINFSLSRAKIFQAESREENNSNSTFLNTLFESKFAKRVIQESDVLALLDIIILCILLLTLISLKNKRYSISFAVIVFFSIFYWFNHFSGILSITLETPKSGQIQAYWKTKYDINIFDENKSKSKKFIVQPGKNKIDLPLYNLNNIEQIRIDPDKQKIESKIYSIELSAPGYSTIRTNSQDHYSRISFDQGNITSNYLQIESQNSDPFFVFNASPEINKSIFYFIVITCFITFFFSAIIIVLPKNSRSFSRIIQVVPIIIFLYILYLANFSWYDAHPDEQSHIASVNYYTEYTEPPKVGDSRTQLTYQYPWGISRLDNLGISYLFFGKIKALLSEISNNSTFNARATNCLLFGLLTLFCFRNKKFAYYCLPLFCIPQVWYLFSYTNRGGFALFISILLGWELVNRKSQFKQYLEPKQKIVNYFALPMGVLTGILMIEQTNYLSFILYALALIFMQFLQIKTHRQQFIKKIAFIISIALMIVGIRYAYDVSINGFNKIEQQIVVAEKLAAPEFKPSIAGTKLSYKGLRLFEKGVNADELFSQPWNWDSRTFKSFTGFYGGVQGLFSAEWYYDSVKIIYFLILLILFIDLFKRPKKYKRHLFIITLVFIALSIVMGFLFSWLYDFQPQGRYIFPLIPILMVYLQSAKKDWAHHTKQTLSAFSLLLILLSAYSFRTTALPYLVDIRFFNHFLD